VDFDFKAFEKTQSGTPCEKGGITMKPCKIIIVVILVLCGSQYSSLEATAIKGPILEGERWIREESPYLIEGDVEVRDLTIDPGVEVWFMGDYFFEVTGTLDAVGTEETPILFTSRGKTQINKGIDFHATASTSKLIYCKIELAGDYAIRIYYCTPEIKYCSIEKDNLTKSEEVIYIELLPEQKLKITECVLIYHLYPNINNYEYGSLKEKHTECHIDSMSGDKATLQFNLKNIINRYTYIISGKVNFTRCVVIDNNLFKYFINDLGI